MKQNKIYGLILAVSMLMFSGCGTDTKENPPLPDGPYSFFDATTPKKITKYAAQGTEISVTLLKYGLAEPGQLVEMVPFSSEYGQVESLHVETDENGKATFIYKAPEGSDYTDIKGQEYTITAIFEEPDDLVATPVSTTTDSPPNVILTQEFVLQFF